MITGRVAIGVTLSTRYLSSNVFGLPKNTFMTSLALSQNGAGAAVYRNAYGVEVSKGARIGSSVIDCRSLDGAGSWSMGRCAVLAKSSPVRNVPLPTEAAVCAN